jgi:hypothetical protein
VPDEIVIKPARPIDEDSVALGESEDLPSFMVTSKSVVDPVKGMYTFSHKCSFEINIMEVPGLRKALLQMPVSYMTRIYQKKSQIQNSLQ